ncbi:MAG TPA: carbamoyl-phosphate synthase (glutamine-hydrolyzing) large subunit [Candidatus Nanoarchaeia archaeon]|nr:carbamoyl-phosphate synthase (glutamine-hydrolyzing) large subunit [Candidatus Nanoarchaeia archaeon]
MKPKKVLLLGSGALKIGEAGEFDYSGSQAIKALKEEGVYVVLVNPNIATIQTSENLADKVYFLPVNAEFVEKVIQKEKPDAILLQFGGQTALNCGLDLDRLGILKKYNVRVLGTPIEAIRNTEDRELFVKKLTEIKVATPVSKAVTTTKDALKVAEKIKYPVMIRAGFSLGGKGSGIACSREQLNEIAERALADNRQILVEKYLGGWKEIEYEIVRDSFDNCITVCNMENFDPMGIHTGESIVVAPSQTLTNEEYHKLRGISIKVIRHLGIVGECNIQYALNPKSEEYAVIEVNARLSRSSALASKATGYPLAFIACKLALGHSLTEIQNSITKKTMACFEPALDYCVVKIPRWDLNKFKNVSKQVGSEMKSVGEVMAIGRKFEEAFQKAIRMLGKGMLGLTGNGILFNDIESELKNPTDERVFAVAKALEDTPIEKIYGLSGIDPWFLKKMANIIEITRRLKRESLAAELLREAKQHGFSDSQIAAIKRVEEDEVTKTRKKLGIIPFVKQIDTLAAEYPAKTNYLYLTYNGSRDDVSFREKEKIMVLGSGAYSIGSSVEFDWCCVNSALALRKLGYITIMVNYNPETVSTDYDTCDKLYFDELSAENICEIYEKECPVGIVISMGGQIPNNLAKRLGERGIKLIGTSPESIDNAENRHKFSALLDELKIDQPEWSEQADGRHAVAFANKVGFPVLVRPSYVLSGSAMNVAMNEEDLRECLKAAAYVSKEHPVVVSKFVTDAKEIELDGVAKNGNLIVWAISEHVENAGVHSGDATLVFPAQRTYLETTRKVKAAARKICKALNITGPFNIQFIAKDNNVMVIECNLRASRSFPFVSKILKVNFIEIATRAMVNAEVPEINKSAFELDYVGVKSPQFSFSRLRGADPVLSVEMASTGEVACLGHDVREAFLKSIIATGMKLPKKNVLLSIGGEEKKHEFLKYVRKLVGAGFEIFATEHTSQFLKKNGIWNTVVFKAHEDKENNVLNLISEKKIGLAILIPEEIDRQMLMDEYMIRIKAVDFAVPLLTNFQVAKLFVNAIVHSKNNSFEIKSWDEYE